MREFQGVGTGIVIEMIKRVMLVKGGYLHSMKLLIEKAENTPNPVPAKRSRSRNGILSRSLRRISGFLLGWY